MGMPFRGVSSISTDGVAVILPPQKNQIQLSETNRCLRLALLCRLYRKSAEEALRKNQTPRGKDDALGYAIKTVLFLSPASPAKFASSFECLQPFSSFLLGCLKLGALGCGKFVHEAASRASKIGLQNRKRQLVKPRFETVVSALVITKIYIPSIFKSLSYCN